MKRTLAILLALIMSLGLLAACGGKGAQSTAENPAASAQEQAEPASEAPVEEADGLTVYDFVGDWQDEISQRASMTILAAGYDEYGDAHVRIHWGNSAFDAVVWDLYAAFDEASGRLYYANGSKELVSFPDGGEEQVELLADDAEGTFTFDADGKLVWNDTAGGESNEGLFVRIETPIPTTDEFVNGYFDVVGGYAAGTAGSSLAEAQAAYQTLRFADTYGFWAMDVSAMRDGMLAAWESMTQEQRDAFDENFVDVAQLLNSCFDDFAAARDIFDDVGVGDELEGLVKSDVARASWEVLSANTFTMGNSES